MAKNNNPSSLSIISAIVFIILLVGLAIYAGKKGPDTNKDAKNKKVGYTDYSLSSNDDISVGPADAKVTFVEYYDYECPACQYLDSQILPTLVSDYKDRVKFVFKQFPLKQHEQARLAASAVICANDQGKFQEYNDLLVKNYDDWTKNSDLLEEYAKRLGLDLNKFSSCKNSRQVSDFIDRNINDGTIKGLEATPTVYINDEKMEGVQDLNIYKQKIDELLNK